MAQLQNNPQPPAMSDPLQRPTSTSFSKPGNTKTRTVKGAAPGTLTSAAASAVPPGGIAQYYVPSIQPLPFGNPKDPSNQHEEVRVITNDLEPPSSARGSIVSAGGSAGSSPRGAAVGNVAMNLSVAGQKRNTSANDREKVTNALLYM
jgi:hypothetical protein